MTNPKSFSNANERISSLLSGEIAHSPDRSALPRHKPSSPLKRPVNISTRAPAIFPRLMRAVTGTNKTLAYPCFVGQSEWLDDRRPLSASISIAVKIFFRPKYVTYSTHCTRMLRFVPKWSSISHRRYPLGEDRFRTSETIRDDKCAFRQPVKEFAG